MAGSSAYLSVSAPDTMASRFSNASYSEFLYHDCSFTASAGFPRVEVDDPDNDDRRSDPARAEMRWVTYLDCGF